MRVRVLINGGAGSVDDDEQLSRQIVAAFAAAGAKARVDVVEPDVVPDTIRGWWAADDRPDVIVVAGGDGTVNCAAGVAAGTDIVISVLPLGTFNHFAGDLGIPDDIDAAAVAIVDGEVRYVDVGEVTSPNGDSEVFVNNSALGVYPTMVAIRDRIRDQRGWGKVRAVPVACVSVLRNLPVHRLELTGSGRFVRHKVRTPFVFIGNGRYDNGAGGTAERTDMDGGKLHLAVARATSRFGLVRTAFAALLCGVERSRDVDTFELEELTIGGRAKRLRVARDGEIAWMDLPFTYRCRPDALAVRSPRRA